MASKTVQQNVADNQPIFVGIDDGHSDVKIVLPDGTTFKYVTRISDGAKVADFPGMESTPTVYKVHDSNNDSTRSYTTHQYLQDNDTVDVRFDQYPTSDYNVVLVQNALINSGLGGKKVIICTGLPVSSHYRNGKINKELVDAKVANLMRPVEVVGGTSMAIIQKNYVATEALASYMDAIINMDGTPSALYKTLKDEVVAVLDIGGKTTDFAVLYNGGQVVDKQRLGSFNLGVLDLKDEISLALKEKYDFSSLSLRHINSALVEGTLKYGGQVHNVEKLANQLKKDFISKLISTIDRKLGDLGDVDKILCVGGGAQLLQEHLLEKYKNQALIVNNPDFANARGMYKIAKYIMKGK